MRNLFKIAIRNLFRYKRRTLLTVSLITIGVVFVLGYISVAGSFKNMMVAQITDSSLGHLQVHRQGYMAAVESLPLTMNLKARPIKILDDALKAQPEVESYSPRIRLGGMFSTFVETTSIRLNGVYPDREFKTVPLLPSRIIKGEKHLFRGEIFVPELLANGMGVKPGDTVVLVSSNKDGSVNGMQFKVSGILESAQGPGGRDGYINFDDALQLLRMPEVEWSEMAIRLKDFSQEPAFTKKLEGLLGKELNQKGKPIFTVDPWEKLTPFYNIARMIDVMSVFIKVMLIAVVLVSIMNVMIMAVFERVREIGTIAAIGTSPGKILSMFVMEGFSLGAIGVIVGDAIGLAIVLVLNLVGVSFDFGRQKGLILKATIAPADVLIVSGIVILIAVLASLQPALKASRMEPIEALRHYRDDCVLERQRTEGGSAMKKAMFIATVLVSLLAVQAFAAQTMKIAVAAADKTVTAAVSDQAGAAPYFLFFDGKGRLLEAIENPYKNAESPGPSVVNYLAGKGATVMVAGGFGPKIVEVMKGKGITAVSFKGSAQDAVKKVLQSK